MSEHQEPMLFGPATVRSISYDILQLRCRCGWTSMAVHHQHEIPEKWDVEEEGLANTHAHLRGQWLEHIRDSHHD